MTYKEKVAWLSSYRKALEEQHFLQEEIQRLRSEAERMTAVCTGMPRGGAPDGGRVPRAVERIDTAQKMLEEQMQTCLERRMEVTGAIGHVTDPGRREVLRLRYLEGRCYHEIADEMGLVERQVYRLHRRGVEDTRPPAGAAGKGCQ